MQKLIIQGCLTDLNKFLRAMSNNRYGGGKIKREETERVAWEAKLQKLIPITEYPVKITYKWFSKDNRIDVDNVAFSKKFINDGLVMAGILKNDSRKFVAEFSDKFPIDKDNPRVEVELSTV